MSKLFGRRGLAAAAFALGLSAGAGFSVSPASAIGCDQFGGIGHRDGCSAFETPEAFYESLKGETEEASAAYEPHRGEGEREPRPEPVHAVTVKEHGPV